jgi:hypothetical protein
MRALTAGLVVFAVAVAAQAVVWRLRRPARQYRGFVLLYATVLALGLAAFGMIRAQGGPLAALVPGSLFEQVNFGVLYLSLAAAFAVTYSAIQADSPTMTILLRIEAAGPGGASRSELLAELTDERLVLPRLDDLVEGGLAMVRDGRYVIAAGGATIAAAYVRFRRLLRMERGG